MIRAALALASATVLLAGTPTSARELPPEGSEPKPFQLPDRTRLTLDNGLSVNLIPFGKVPKVTVMMVVRTGNIDEQGDTWLADITGQLMMEGTTQRDAAEVARIAAGMGCDIDIGVGMDRTTLQADVLAEHGPAVVGLMAEVLTSPRLPDEELDRIRADFLRSLSVARTQPGALANEAFYGQLFPDHAYGRVYPSEEQLAGYTIDDVRRHYAGQFGAARTHVYVSGQFDAAAMEQAIRDAFGAWKAGPPPRVDIPPADNALRVKLIDRPGAPQSTIHLGLIAADPSSPDYLDFQMMNLLLGGAFSSRITANIREDKGYTYSPRSSVIARYRIGVWRQVADVTTEHTGAAISEILKEIRRLQDAEPSADEVTATRNYRTGTFIMSSATRRGLLAQMAFVDTHGLPDEYLTQYTRNVHRVDAADFTGMARRCLLLLMAAEAVFRRVPATVRSVAALCAHG